MAIVDLESTAAALVAAGKGILAADETPKTLTKRFDSLNVHSTPDTRRSYREMPFTTTGIAQFISGVVMQDETIHQQSSIGETVRRCAGAAGHHTRHQRRYRRETSAGTTAENITEGLDGLRDRLMDHAQTAARFAKWRAVIRIGDALPTSGCVRENAHALARDAALKSRARCPSSNLKS
jgi:fructose-bisphosphate aldolase class I